MKNKKVETFLLALKDSGLDDDTFRELAVSSDRVTGILVVLGMHGIPTVNTDLSTDPGRQPCLIIASKIKSAKPTRQVITDIFKSFAVIAISDEVFEGDEKFSGHLTFITRKLKDAVLMQIEMPFWSGCVSALGNRTMMKFLDIVME